MKLFLSWVVAPFLQKMIHALAVSLGRALELLVVAAEVELGDAEVAGAELGGAELGASEGPSGAELACFLSGSSGLSSWATALAPAATATGPADEPATRKNPPPTPPTTVTPTATTMVSPWLTVVVAGWAVDVGAADETGGFVTVGEVVGGAEGG